MIGYLLLAPTCANEKQRKKQQFFLLARLDLACLFSRLDSARLELFFPRLGSARLEVLKA